MSISSTGQITVNAVTDAMWGVLINMTACENGENGNPSACQPPSYAPPSANVYTTISPTGTQGSNTNGCGVGCAQLQLTAQATQAGTYTETSQHNASYPVNGTLQGYTQAQQAFKPYISGISPNQIGASAYGTTITLSGAGLGGNLAINAGGAGTFSGSGSSNGTSATFTIDPFASSTPAGTYQVTATSNGLTSNAAQLTVVCAVPTNFQQSTSACQASGELDFGYTFSSSTGNPADIAGCLVGEAVFYTAFPPPSPPWPPGGAGYVNPTLNYQPAVNGLNVFDKNLPPTGSFVTPYSNSTFSASQSFSYSCNCTGSVFFPGYEGIPVTRMLSNQQGPWAYVVQKSGGACGFSLPPQ